MFTILRIDYDLFFNMAGTYIKKIIIKFNMKV